MLTEISGGWCMEKSTKGLSSLGGYKLSKKAQDKYYEIKNKLYTDNRNWNDCKFRLH